MVLTTRRFEKKGVFTGPNLRYSLVFVFCHCRLAFYDPLVERSRQVAASTTLEFPPLDRIQHRKRRHSRAINACFHPQKVRMNLLGIHGNTVQADNLSLHSLGRNTIKGKHIDESTSRFSHLLKVWRLGNNQKKMNCLDGPSP